MIKLILKTTGVGLVLIWVIENGIYLIGFLDSVKRNNQW